MDLELKLKLLKAIGNVLDKEENPSWDYLIHPTLYKDMTDAAELIFNACQDAQAYYNKETNV